MDIKEYAERIRNERLVISELVISHRTKNIVFHFTDITMIFTKPLEPDRDVMCLVFRNCRSVSLKDEVLNTPFRPAFIIEDISDRGYENCNYFVKDAEEECSFYCESIKGSE